MTILEQTAISEHTREFLSQWGLKQKFVAKACGISEPVFSKFINGKIALSPNQIGRVVVYMNDYEHRNS